MQQPAQQLRKFKLNDLPENSEVGSHYTSQKTIHFNHFLTYPQMREMSQYIADAAILLYNHYADVLMRNKRSPANQQQQITDTRAAQELGWKEAKAKRLRLELQRYSWFHVEPYTTANGVRGVNYYLGKDQVSAALKRSAPTSTPTKKPKEKVIPQTKVFGFIES